MDGSGSRMTDTGSGILYPMGHTAGRSLCSMDNTMGCLRRTGSHSMQTVRCSREQAMPLMADMPLIGSLGMAQSRMPKSRRMHVAKGISRRGMHIMSFHPLGPIMFQSCYMKNHFLSSSIFPNL